MKKEFGVENPSHNLKPSQMSRLSFFSPVAGGIYVEEVVEVNKAP